MKARRISSGTETSDGTPMVALANTKATTMNAVKTATTHDVRLLTPRFYAVPPATLPRRQR
jgi:hypothetical protein